MVSCVILVVVCEITEEKKRKSEKNKKQKKRKRQGQRRDVSMLTSSYNSEDDHFRNRLDSINKEMQAIIERTATEREKMFCGSATLSTPWRFAECVHADEAEAPSVMRASATARVGVDEATVRRIVADEMNLWKTTLQDMLSQAMVGVKNAVKQRLEEVSRHQTEFAETLQEAGEASRRGLGEMQSSLSRLQRCTSRSVEDLSRELKDHVGRITMEQSRLRDAVSALQNEARIDQQRGDRRVDELVRRHHDIVRNSLLELDTHVASLQDEVQKTVRLQTRQLTEEQDAIEQHVARLQGTLEATNDTTVKWAAELHNLIEDNVTCQGEVRACRRDVNQLAIVLRRVLGGCADTSVISKGKENIVFNDVSGVLNGIDSSGVEFLALKERVSRVESKIKKMDQKMMGGMAATLPSLDHGNVVTGDAFFVSGNTHREVGKVPDRHGVLTTKGAIDATYSKLPQQLSGPSVQKQHEKSVKTSQGKRHSFSKTSGAKNAPQSDLSLRSFSVSSQTSFHAQPKTRISNDELTTPQQQREEQKQKEESGHLHHPLENVYGACPQSHVLGSLDPQGRSACLTEKDSCDDREGLSQTLNHSSPLILKFSGREQRAPENLTPVVANLLAYSKKSSTPDSYMSEIDDKRKGNDSSMQYVPAPTSDIESELDNKKMARLALD